MHVCEGGPVAAHRRHPQGAQEETCDARVAPRDSAYARAASPRAPRGVDSSPECFFAPFSRSPAASWALASPFRRVASLGSPYAAAPSASSLAALLSHPRSKIFLARCQTELQQLRIHTSAFASLARGEPWASPQRRWLACASQGDRSEQGGGGGRFEREQPRRVPAQPADTDLLQHVFLLVPPTLSELLRAQQARSAEGDDRMRKGERDAHQRLAGAEGSAETRHLNSACSQAEETPPAPPACRTYGGFALQAYVNLNGLLGLPQRAERGSGALRGADEIPSDASPVRFPAVAPSSASAFEEAEAKAAQHAESAGATPEERSNEDLSTQEGEEDLFLHFTLEVYADYPFEPPCLFFRRFVSRSEIRRRQHQAAASPASVSTPSSSRASPQSPHRLLSEAVHERLAALSREGTAYALTHAVLGESWLPSLSLVILLRRLCSALLLLSFQAQEENQGQSTHVNLCRLEPSTSRVSLSAAQPARVATKAPCSPLAAEREARKGHLAGASEFCASPPLASSAALSSAAAARHRGGETECRRVRRSYGDFEAQRHWMEITFNLPLSVWYTYGTFLSPPSFLQAPVASQSDPPPAGGPTSFPSSSAERERRGRGRARREAPPDARPPRAEASGEDANPRASASLSPQIKSLWWPLDYPPLSAFFALALAPIAFLAHPPSVVLWPWRRHAGLWSLETAKEDAGERAVDRGREGEARRAPSAKTNGERAHEETETANESGGERKEGAHQRTPNARQQARNVAVAASSDAEFRAVEDEFLRVFMRWTVIAADFLTFVLFSLFFFSSSPPSASQAEQTPPEDGGGEAEESEARVAEASQRVPYSPSWLQLATCPSSDATRPAQNARGASGLYAELFSGEKREAARCAHASTSASVSPPAGPVRPRSPSSPSGSFFARASSLLCRLSSDSFCGRASPACRCAGTETSSFLSLALLLLSPPLLLVDDGHFQYNGVALGLVTGAAACLFRGQDLCCALCFSLALLFKQTMLYFAPAFFAVLLSRASRRLHFKGRLQTPQIFHLPLRTCMWRVSRLALVVLAVAACVFSPFLLLHPPAPLSLSQQQEASLAWSFSLFPPPGEAPVDGRRTGERSGLRPPAFSSSLAILYNRIFPFHRGVYEDYVANVWIVLSPVLRLRDRLAADSSPFLSEKMLLLLSIGLTLLGLLPACVAVYAHPTRERFLAALFCSASSFFLFSFHVHEKAILLPLSAALLMLPRTPEFACLYSMMATFSLLHLMQKDFLVFPASLLLVCFFFLSALLVPHLRSSDPLPATRTHGLTPFLPQSSSTRQATLRSRLGALSPRFSSTHGSPRSFAVSAFLTAWRYGAAASDIGFCLFLFFRLLIRRVYLHVTFSVATVRASLFPASPPRERPLDLLAQKRIQLETLRSEEAQVYRQLAEVLRKRGKPFPSGVAREEAARFCPQGDQTCREERGGHEWLSRLFPLVLSPVGWLPAAFFSALPQVFIRPPTRFPYVFVYLNCCLHFLFFFLSLVAVTLRAFSAPSTEGRSCPESLLDETREEILEDSPFSGSVHSFVHGREKKE
ncbi:hypothetical protein BESB_002010 [Besnoitia besnoiti]|uniref:dolichyl-P-Glc:Man9GlcNAc2-PP-dolichol alpha-1,3-glucosyltransferase n=1 Tax=Besnoitia besnoiti TaxID=94643 RepID=A0A2A9MPR1_BESBE|nr:hypothetical protein BESB_002010 [Besnoitia besnoiti]PFH37860.1 hypothetical protein BESB_002010 [Besnoitia besnoiti]